MTRVSYNDHVSQLVSQNGSLALVQPFTGYEAGKIVFTNVNNLRPIIELSRTEKAIELQKRKVTSW